MNRKRRPVVECVAVAVSLSLCLSPSLALAWQSTNPNNKVGIYDIRYYGQQYDAASRGWYNWKDSIPVSDTSMQAQTLFDSFNCSDTNICGYNTSFRLYDNNVTVSNMCTYPGTYNASQASLLFFYGHNLSPKVYDALAGAFPSWYPYGTVSSYPYSVWGPINGSWQQASLCSGYPGQTTGCYRTIFDWATTYTPYYYHWTNGQTGQYGIRDASWGGTNYSVFYAYNPLTSMLVGKDWTSLSWPFANTVGQTSPTGYGLGGLGTSAFGSNSPTNFFVGNGCEALPVVGWVDHYPTANGAIWIDEGIRTWKSSWGSNLHAVMGHTEETSTGELPSMYIFYYYMAMGLGVIEGYFMAHAYVSYDPNDPLNYAPSAIAPRATLPNGQDVYAYDAWYPRAAPPTGNQEGGTHYKAWFLLPTTTQPQSYQW